MKKLWNRFTAWLSGWPESKHRIEEEEKMIKKNNKKIKKKPNKKTEIMN